MKNRLAGEVSPYLLQHKDNPVAWRAWDEAALAEARATAKPILLSVGYAACHWCHVMAHESFEDEAIAEIANRHFIPIKVDREERPDIDHIYQTALGHLGGSGGWPLTMFLDPDGAPFWGGTYFPREPRHGLPGFGEVLQRVADAFAQDQTLIDRNRKALTEAVRASIGQTLPGALKPADLDAIDARLLDLMDQRHGGTMGAPKFPNVPLLDALWHGWWRSGDDRYRDIVVTTLRHICQGGIYDHLGGGFSRYSVDGSWLVPHFEKMLYDNALLVSLLTDAWAATGNEIFAQRVAETIAWVEREMLVDGGGFAASLDADSDGEEGKFYVWDAIDIRDRLGSDAGLFADIYGVNEVGNWEGHNILNRLGHPELLDDKTEGRLRYCRGTLLAARAARVRPGFDDKTLADWSGMMVAALAKAAMVFDQPRWLARAKAGFEFVTTHMMTENGRLCHSARAGHKGVPAMLDDYAQMGLAALRLAQATGDAGYLGQARIWAAILNDQFADQDHGGWFQTPADGEILLARPRPIHDQATPSGNAAAIGLFAGLAAITGESPYRDRAERAVSAFAGGLERGAGYMGGYLAAYADLAHPVEILLAGDIDADLIRAAWIAAPPGAVIQRVSGGDELAPGHPGAGIGRAAGAYVCEAMTCSLPLTTPAALKARLGGILGWSKR